MTHAYQPYADVALDPNGLLPPAAATDAPFNLHIASGLAESAPAAPAPIGQLAALQRTEVTFIEGNVGDLPTLLQGLGPNAEVHLLDASQDGLQQIATILAGRSSIDALHIIAHGATAAVNFGSLQLDNGSLAAHSAELRAIGASLAPDADLLLYSCDTAQGSDGAAFIQQLAIVTGADVAASSNLSGSAAQGGDWQLEVRSGQIDTAAVVNPALAALYHDVLSIASATLTFDTPSRFGNYGSHLNPATDIIYNVNGSTSYQLRINGLTKGITYYAINMGYIVSDSATGTGETEIDFSFDTGQVFTPGAFSFANYQSTGVQKLIFRGFDAAGNQVGSTQTINTSSTVAQYVTINFSGLSNISKLKLTADPTSANPGKLEYLVFDNLALTNIQPPPPAVTSVSSTSANGAYQAGQTIAITVTFSSAVDVTGTPQLKLANGGAGRTINYASGSGSNTLSFNYTVQAGDTSSDLDVFNSSALTLNGGTIKLQGNATDATLALATPGSANSLGANKALVIDTTAPNAPTTLTMLAASDKGNSSSDGVTYLTTPTITGSAETGATVTLYDSNGTTVLGTGTASGGAFSIAVTSALSEGVHNITAKATDAAGNVSSASSAVTATIDTTAPTLAITSNVSSLNASDTATITFTFSEDPGSSFSWDGSAGDVVVSGGTLGAISGSGLTRTATFTPTASTNAGSASISVAGSSYTDSAGNNGGAGTPPSLSFDTLAPVAPSAPTLAAASDSGVSNSDLITQTTTLTFTGTAEAGATVNLYDSNGTTVLGTGVASGGNWSITTSALSAAAHTVTAKATDAAGNTGAASSATVVTVDTLAPTVAISSNVATLKAGDTATVTFTFSEDPGNGFAWNGSSGAVTVTGGTLGAISGSGLTRSATFTPTAATNAGTASISVAAAAYTDKAGNDGGAGSALTLSYDTQGPTVSAPQLASASDSGISNSDARTNLSTPTLSGTAEAGATVNLYDTDGTTLLGTTVATGGVWSMASATLGAGAHTLKATATDSAGNVSALSSGLDLVIDTSAPTLAISSNVATLKVGETATITFTFSEDPGSGFSWNGSSGAVTVSGGTLGAITGSGLTRTATFTPTAGVDSGSASIAVAASAYTDQAGNGGGAGTPVTLTYDTLAPAAPSTPDLDSASDSGLSSSDNITNISTPTFTGSATSGTTVTLYDTDGSTVLGSTVASGGAWSITSTTLGSGIHQISATTSDAAGNVSASSALAVDIATTPPTLAITSSAATLHGGQTATITFTFSSDPGASFSWDGSSGDVVVSGGTLGAIAGSGLTRTAVFTPTPNLNSGSASITVAAATYTDAVSNSGGAGTSPALTFDTLAPSAPATPTLASASDSGISNSDAITSVTTPVISGTADANASITLYDSNGTTVLGTGTASGGAFSIAVTSALSEGVHNITAKATDAAGNVSSASSAATITIDTTAPTLAISSNVSSLNASDTATITFTFSEDPGSSFSWDGSAGDVVVSGGTLGAISGSGLTRTATFTPTTSTNAGSASISVAGSSYTDSAGNNGGAGTPPSLSFDTLAPVAPSAPTLAAASDSGDSNSDLITQTTTLTFTGTAEAGATVNLYDSNGTTVLGTGVASGGNWSITTSALSAAAHTVTAKATDAAGNTGAASSATVVTVDTLAPTVAISSNLATLKAGDTATVTFTFSEDPGNSFAWNGSSGAVTVTGGTLGAISGSGLTRSATFTPSAATNAGTASISVAAAAYTDKAGNDGGAGSALTLSYDTQGPTIAAPQLASASDSGISNSDARTNLSTPTLSGTAEAGATVNLYDTDGTTLLGTTVATGGVWSVASATLGAGTHTLKATATDSAGNVSALSSGLDLVIDTSAPTLAISSNVATLKGGETATITFTFSEDPGSGFSWDGSSGAVTVSGGALGAITGSGLTRTATFTPTNGVDSGSASIAVAASAYTDQAGNGGGAGTPVTLTYDTLAPVAPSTPDLDSASDSGLSSSDNITNISMPTFTGSATNGTTVTLYDTDGSTVLGSTVASGGVWSITSTTLGSGIHQISAKNSDTAGNVSTSSALAVDIATTPPTLAITSSAATLLGGQTATITFTFSSDPGASFSWDGSSGDVVVSGGTLGAIAGSGLTRTAVFTPTPNLNSGSASITVAAATYMDAVGNNGGAGTSPALTFDTLAPSAPATPTLASASDSGASNSDAITSVTTPVISGTADANASVTLYDSNGTTVLGTTTSDGSGNWSITSSTLSDGSHTLSAKQSDTAGNLSPASGALTVLIDSATPAAPSAPVLATASDSGTLVDNLTNIVTPVLTGSGEPNATVKLYDTDGSTLLGTATANGSGNWSITSSTLSSGSHTLTVKQTDAAGHISAASSALTLTIDTAVPAAPSAPLLATASDTGTLGDLITMTATPVVTGSGEANATVRLYDSDGNTVLGTATADGSGNWSITSSALTVAAHTLSVKQTDVAGNVSAASSTLVLTIAAPPAPPANVIDGVTVDQQTVTLPGGGSGTQIVIPVVSTERAETSGNGSVADIPLVTGGGSNLLLAQVAPGFGLTASGGDSQPAGDSTEHLIQAILAATPNNPADDRSHLTGNGVTFLNQLAATVPLLVQTITPSSGATAPGAALTLTGTSGASQHTALVIDTTKLAAGSQLVLQAVDFAALVGAASVTGNTNGQILTGDQASQQFTVAAGLSSNLFSGGGDDTLVFQSPARSGGLAPAELRQGAAAATHSVLHGGLDNDSVRFNGAYTDYTLDWHQGYVVVAAKAQPQQQALVINVETLVFSDQSVTVQNSAQLKLIAGLYEDVLQRQGDYKGVEFWANAVQSGRTLGGVALDLIRSAESQALHVLQFNGERTHDIELLYQTIYSRHSDAGGLAFWDAAMQRGATLEQVADAMLHAPEITSHQIAAAGWDFLLG